MQKISIEMPKRSAKMTEISVKRPFRPQCVEKLAQYGGKNNTMKITTITVFRISEVFLQLTNDIRTHDIYEQKDKKRCSSKETIKVNIEKLCILNDRGAKN